MNAQERLADATRQLEKRTPRTPPLPDYPLTEEQKLDIQLYHLRLVRGYRPTMPSLMKDLIARDYEIVNPCYADADQIRAIPRSRTFDDQRRADRLAARMKQAGIGVYDTKNRGRGRLPALRELR